MTALPAPAERVLAALLLLLTGMSGLCDAVSYLQLGHVFVANMTGNVVFLGFGLAGAGGLSLVSSAVAVASFFVGALAAGRFARLRSSTASELLRDMTGFEFFLVLISACVLLTLRSDHVAAYATVALLAAAMGIQSSTTSRLQIRGFNSTVVLTTMLATMAATSRLAGGTGADNGRRLLAITSMFAGGLAGAFLTLHVTAVAPLILAAVVAASGCLGAHAIKCSLSRQGRSLNAEPANRSQ